jgi:hypothetical protein
MIRSLKKSFVVLKRELLSYFLSPLAYIVWVAFLLLNGYIFFAIISFLSDPLSAGGAPMPLFFGGSLLYWLVQTFFMSAITMRLFAEEARLGTLEHTLTTPISEISLALGKYLGALCFYVFLWAPTLFYIAILIAVSNTPQDMGQVAAGYLGTFFIGVFFLSLGLFASALARNQLIAIIISIFFSGSFLLIGVVKDLTVHKSWREVLYYLDLFGHMSRFGRGLVDSRPVLFSITGAIFFIFASAAVLELRRLSGSWKTRSPSRSLALRWIVSLSSMFFLLVGVNLWSSRHHSRLDWTHNGFYSLSEESRALVQNITNPIEVIVFLTPEDPRFGGFFTDVSELMSQLEDASNGKVSAEYIDPLRDRTRAEGLYQKYKLPIDADLNVVLFSNPTLDRVKYVYGEEMAEYQNDDFGPRLTRFLGEEVFVSALLNVSEPRKKKAYFTTGHGEVSIQPGGQRSLAAFVSSLRDDNIEVEELVFTSTNIPADADSIWIIGPTQPFSEEESGRLEEFAIKGGRLFFALDPVPSASGEGISSSGLSRLLSRWNLRLDDTIVFDPDPNGHIAADESVYSYALLLATPSPDHVITRGLSSMKISIAGARSVSLLESAGRKVSPLLVTSPSAWGEKNFLPDAIPSPQAADLEGPLLVMACSEDIDPVGRGFGGRVIVSGSSSALVDSYFGTPDNRNPGNFQLALRASRWLLSRDQLIETTPKTPIQVRLQLSAENSRVILWLLLGGIPLLGVLLGIFVWQVRRR